MNTKCGRPLMPRSHCPNGHAYAEAGVYTYARTDGLGATGIKRMCKECARATQRRAYARKVGHAA
jgi:hypothetical protein